MTISVPVAGEPPAIIERHHLLIVDDDADIREGLRKYLEDHGFRITLAESAITAKRLMGRASFDLVISDVMMPGEDGFSLCRYIRAASDTPVILLTAMGDDADRIVGLEIGADDYVVKPFNPRELLARIKAVIRRLDDLSRKAGASADVRKYHFDRWTLCPTQRELTDANGVVTPLSTSEFALLLIFVKRPGAILTRQQLIDAARGGLGDPIDRAIDNQVSRLRRKIESDPRSPRIIKTVWGGGYTFLPSVKRA